MGRSRSLSRLSVDAAAVLAGVVAVATFAAASHAGPSGAERSRSSVCRATVAVGVLPVWARAGFRDPNPRTPHVVGHAGDIAGVLFGNPLHAPPRKGHDNKILWISRVPTTAGSNLRISAQRMTGSEPVGSPVKRSVVGGPGPSIINLPTAGCWRLSLEWSGHADTLDLRYVTSR